MRDKILDILNEINPDIDYENEDALIDDELLDSFDIVSLVGELNDVFDVNITVVDLVPDNFNSVDAMEALIVRLTDGQ